MSELTTKQLRAYQQGLAKREVAIEAQCGDRYQRAWLVAQEAAQLLLGQFGVSQLYLFGSLLKRPLFHLRSDIDLGVVGLPERDYYRAVGQLLALDPTITIDLVRLEEAPVSLRKHILEDGQRL